MPSLSIHTSNAMEQLAKILVDVVAIPLSSPFIPETIVVQSRGMEHWVSMQLATQLGVVCNCNFPFPNAFVEQLFTNSSKQKQTRSLFSIPIMTLRIMRNLPSLFVKPGFEDIAGYCADKSDLKLYQLSYKIADVFDQYTMYRPSMLLAWEQTQNSDWQAQLWKCLVQEAQESLHRSHMQHILFDNIKQGTFIVPQNLERLMVFGISYLPPFHLDILVALSHVIDVHLFFLNPSKEYWTDIVSDKEASRITQKEHIVFDTKPDLHLDKGNSLLASFGSYGKEFYSMLFQHGIEDSWQQGNVADDTILHSIQSDILLLQERGTDSSILQTVISKHDYSVQFHACHSQLREVEVLYDELLFLFEKMPELLPKDIIVMTPDVDLYAPYVQAIFGAQAKNRPAIPYSIADRKNSSDSDLIQDFFSVIHVCTGRFCQSAVLALLDAPCIRRSFDISENDIDTIKTWVQKTSVCWGIDELFRQQFVAGIGNENTWQNGLDTLLCGFAMYSDNQTLYNGIAPYQIPLGNSATLLGKFCKFTDTLFSLASELAIKHLPQECHSLFNSITKSFCIPTSDEENAFNDLCTGINSLLDNATSAQFIDAIDVQVAVSIVDSFLSSNNSSAGFLNGNMTVCAMMPMRCIPFKIVCMLGMNDGNFPRKSHRPGWDLIGKNPQQGDRSLEKEDRYVFLEALLSARNVLYISYIGNSIQDNTTLEPSVVVCELFDYIDKAFTFKTGNSTEKTASLLTTHHRLQGFSDVYFRHDSSLKSYSSENCELARIKNTKNTFEKHFFSSELSNPPREFNTVNLSDLLLFFKNSAAFLCTKRLGIKLDNFRDENPDSEPFELDNLNNFILSQYICDSILAGNNAKNAYELFKAQGRIPHKAVGMCAFNECHSQAMSFINKLPKEEMLHSKVNLPFSLAIGDFELTGTLANVYDKGLFVYRFATMRPIDRLSLWIQHCILSSLRPDALVNSRLFTKDYASFFPQTENGLMVLHNLLSYYWKGLSAPLHFFSRSSWEYCVTIYQTGEEQDRALAKANTIWNGSDFSIGEKENNYYQLCFDSSDPIDQNFAQASISIYKPLIDILEEHSL